MGEANTLFVMYVRKMFWRGSIERGAAVRLSERGLHDFFSGMTTGLRAESVDFLDLLD